MNDRKKEVNKASLEELTESKTGERLEDIDLLGDVELPVRVEFSRTEKTVEDVLGFEEGSIIKLDRFAGEHVDIYVDESLFARGEIVVVDDKFGVRVAEILAPEKKD